MINVLIYENTGQYKGFKVSGHSGYAEEGSDIICAAISAMTINCANSIEQLTSDKIECIEDEQTATIEVKFAEPLSAQANLLVDSFVLGVQAILEGNEQYIKLEYKEV